MTRPVHPISALSQHITCTTVDNFVQARSDGAHRSFRLCSPASYAPVALKSPHAHYVPPITSHIIHPAFLVLSSILIQWFTYVYKRSEKKSSRVRLKVSASCMPSHSPSPSLLQSTLPLGKNLHSHPYLHYPRWPCHELQMLTVYVLTGFRALSQMHMILRAFWDHL